LLQIFEFIDDPVKGTKAVDDLKLAMGRFFPVPTYSNCRITYKRIWDDNAKAVITSLLFEYDL
jgi:hypothetical protein